MVQGKAYFTKYREKNRQRIREKARISAKVARELAIQALGRLCVSCGFSDVRALQIDHINGGGCKEKKVIRNNTNYHLMVTESVIKGEGKYQLLCANCNWIKRVENKEINGYSTTK